MCNTTSNFTQAQLDALTEAISQGVKSVKYSDKEVVYASIDEMMRLREQMRTELCGEVNPNTGVSGRRRRVALYYSGLYPNFGGQWI